MFRETNYASQQNFTPALLVMLETFRWSGLEWTGMGWNVLELALMCLNGLKWAGVGWNVHELAGICWNRLE